MKPDPDTDLTLLYVNNTIYGEYSRGGWTRLDSWRSRTDGNVVKITVLNGDYFTHAFHSVDFGGNRGWENQFKSSIPIGGIGSFFTFGRIRFLPLTPPGAILVPPALPLERLSGVADKQWRTAVRRNADGNPIDGCGESITIQDCGKTADCPADPDGRVNMLPAYNLDRGPDGVQLGVQRVMIEFNFDPSRRLRFYNFDPLHHDVAIFPVH